jgi:hypothetical protein
MCHEMQDSAVDTETRYGLDGPGFEPGSEGIFLFSRADLGITQPPIKWDPLIVSRVKLAGHGVDHPAPFSAEVDHPAPFSAEVDDERIYNFPAPVLTWHIVARTLILFFLLLN